jgi:AcrR family transcriptional regulator
MARRTYHHGNLRAALVQDARELVAERGPSPFSVAEVARRAGVSSGAPYRHFPNRETLLAAVALELARQLVTRLREALPDLREPLGDETAAETLGQAAAVYTRFTVENGAGLDLIFSHELAGLDDLELIDAGRAVMDCFIPAAMSVTRGDARAALELIERQIAAGHGYASLYRTGFLGRRNATVEDVAEHARAIALSLATSAREFHRT